MIEAPLNPLTHRGSIIPLPPPAEETPSATPPVQGEAEAPPEPAAEAGSEAETESEAEDEAPVVPKLMATVVVDRDLLVARLKWYAKVIPAKSVSPSLGAIQLHVVAGVGGWLTLRGGEVGQYLEVNLACDTSGAGVVLLPFDSFREAMGRMGEGALCVELYDSGVTVVQGGAKLRFPVVDPEGMLPPPETRFTAGFSLGVPGLRRMLTACLPCVSEDESRYILNGVYLHREEDRLVAVGCDGRRLTRVAGEIIDSWRDMAEKWGQVLPTDAVKALLAILPEEDTFGLQFESCPEGCKFEGAVDGHGWRYWANTVQGDYPAYEQVIPKEHDIEFFLTGEEREAVLKALARVGFTGEFCRLQFHPHQLTITSQKSLTGAITSEEVVPLSEGEAFLICLHVEMFTAPLKLAPEGMLCFQVKDELSALLVTAPDYTYVQMPARMS